LTHMVLCVNNSVPLTHVPLTQEGMAGGVNMKILVIGGTKFFGVHMIEDLLDKDHEVTIATRGITKDNLGDRVTRIIIDRTNPESIENALGGKHFDVVIDKIAYCSNDIKAVLDVVSCDKYIHTSTVSVYYDTDKSVWTETDFDPYHAPLKWCSRTDYHYGEIKRQAECAIFQAYRDISSIAVRVPLVIGKDDYTKRLFFYIENTMKSVPMHIDNLDNQISFIRSDEAGKFMAFLADKDFTGPINGGSNGSISLREIIDYVEMKTGKKAILDENGVEAPYNGFPAFCINTDIAKKLGFEFTTLSDWVYELLDEYIDGVSGGQGVSGGRSC
jgi:nucleoside-diphosphate-sugar epimerase